MTVFCGQVYKILLERWCYLSWTVIYTKAKLLDVINTPAKNYPLLPKLKHDDDYWLHSGRQRDRVSLRLYLLKIENQFSLISQSYIISHRHKQYLMTTLYMNDNSITLWQCQVFNLMGISLYFKYTFLIFFTEDKSNMCGSDSMFRGDVYTITEIDFIEYCSSPRDLCVILRDAIWLEKAHLHSPFRKKLICLTAFTLLEKPLKHVYVSSFHFCGE